MKNPPHSYKKWLTIKVAADRLSHTLEPTIEADILQLFVDDEIPIYLRTDRSPVRRVEPHYCTKTERTIWKRFNDNFSHFKKPKKLELTKSNSKRWLRQNMHGTYTTSFVDNGVIVKSGGYHWMVLNPHPSEDYAKRQRTQPAWLTARTDFPAIDELYIKRNDVERFEVTYQTTSFTEKTLFTIIEALRKSHLESSSTQITNEEIIDVILSNQNIRGVSKRTFENVFATAARIIKNSLFTVYSAPLGVAWFT